MSHTYAAVVEDEEFGLHTSTTRRGAIDGALEPLLEAVSIGHKEPGEWTVVVHIDPVWCEKAPQFCDEHDHHKYSRWLDGSASWEGVDVEVYFAYPNLEDVGPEWQYVGIIDELREAFPRLVWGRQSDRPGAALSGGTPKGMKPWSIVVEPDLSRWLLHGDFTNFGDDPIGELRDAIASEGREIAWRADRLTETARLLGGQPQSEWRVAVAEDNAAHVGRQLAEARELVSALEKVGQRLAMNGNDLREEITDALNGTIPSPDIEPADQLLEVAHILSEALEAPLCPEVVEWRRERLESEATPQTTAATGPDSPPST